MVFISGFKIPNDRNDINAFSFVEAELGGPSLTGKGADRCKSGQKWGKRAAPSLTGRLGRKHEGRNGKRIQRAVTFKARPRVFARPNHDLQASGNTG